MKATLALDFGDAGASWRVRFYEDGKRDYRRLSRNPPEAITEAQFVEVARSFARGEPYETVGVDGVEAGMKVPDAAAQAVAQTALVLLLAPGLATTQAPCPRLDCAWPPGSVAGQVMHLNDSHGWSRTQIADWLDTLDIDQDILVATTPAAPASGEQKEDT